VKLVNRVIEFGRANLAVPPAPTLQVEIALRLTQFSIVGNRRVLSNQPLDPL
jgi:hypothetical protein